MRLEAAGPGLSTAVRGRQSAGEELISPGHMGRSLVRSKPGEKCTGMAGRGIRERQQGIGRGGYHPSVGVEVTHRRHRQLITGGGTKKAGGWVHAHLLTLQRASIGMQQ